MGERGLRFDIGHFQIAPHVVLFLLTVLTSELNVRLPFEGLSIF